MTEQVARGVVSTEVDTKGREIVPKTVTVPSKPVNVIWQASGQVRLIGERYEEARREDEALTRAYNEAYDGEMEEEEKEMTRHIRSYHRRRFSDE